jgi:excisionase family DNA binding protein
MQPDLESARLMLLLGFAEIRSRVNAPVMQAESPMGEPRLLTVKEAAAVLRVCAATVYGWCAAGVLPHVRLSTHAIRILSSEVERFVAGRSR